MRSCDKKYKDPAQHSGFHLHSVATAAGVNVFQLHGQSESLNMALPPKVYQFLVGLFASLGSVLFGYDLGVIAQVISSKAFEMDFYKGNLAEFTSKDLSSEEKARQVTWQNETGAVVSVFTGGAFFGAFAAGLMADRLGRRMTIMIGALVSSHSSELSSSANPWHRFSVLVVLFKQAPVPSLTSMLDAALLVSVPVFLS